MVEMGVCNLRAVSLNQQEPRHQNHAPLFLHVFQKVEQRKEDVSAPASLPASFTRHDSFANSSSAGRTTHQFAHPASSLHASCEDPSLRDSATQHGSISYSNLADNTSKRITNRSAHPHSNGYPKYNKKEDASFDAFLTNLITRDVLDTSRSHTGLDNHGVQTNQVLIVDTANRLQMKDRKSSNQSTLGLASNENCLDILSKEEIANHGFSASIRNLAVKVPLAASLCVHSSSKDSMVEDCLDASHAKVVADCHNLVQGEITNDAICKSASPVDEIHDAFTAKEVSHTSPDMGSCASTLGKHADVDTSNAVPVRSRRDCSLAQCMQREVTSDSAICAAMEENMLADNAASTGRGTVEVMHDSRICASTMKKGKDYVASAVPVANTVTKVTTGERAVTYDAGFMVMADAERGFYGDGSAQKVIRDAVYTRDLDTEQDILGAHTTHFLSHAGMHPMMGHSKSLENHQLEDYEAAPDEGKLFVSNNEKSGGQDRCKWPSETSYLWQDQWHFQEDNAGLTAPFIFEPEHADVISTVLDIAKSLPKNEILQDHLHPYSDHIDHLCANAMLYQLQNARLFVPAFSLFEWMRLHTPCLLTSRSLCTIFTISGEANMVDRALVLFNNLKHCKNLWSVQVFNALLSALSKRYRYDKALSVFQEMSNMKIQPDNVTFCILMNLARRSGSGVEVLWQIFCDMEEQKIFAGHEVFAVLMKALCEEGARDEALKLLSLMEIRGLIPNIVIYNILIDAFGKLGRLEEAEGLVFEMKAKGICMSVVTYNILIDAYGNARNFKVAEALLQEMLDKGPVPNVCSYTALIAAYGRHFLSEKAASVFLRMKKNGVAPNAIAYTALIHAYAEDGWYEKAEYAFENMRREGLIPSVETYTSLLHAFRQAGDLRKVKSVWKMMCSERCVGTRATFNVLLDACAKQGDYAEARDVIYEFNKIGIKPDKKTYNMLINAYARGGQHARAPEILKEMKNAGFSPDSFTYTTLIFSFLRVRDFTQAFKYHEKMCQDNQLPDIFTYRKLRALLDEKYEIKTERNVKAVIGAQRARYSLFENTKQVKSFYRRKISLSSSRHRERSR